MQRTHRVQCYLVLVSVEIFCRIFLSVVAVDNVSTAVVARSLYRADWLVHSFRGVLICVGACTLHYNLTTLSVNGVLYCFDTAKHLWHSCYMWQSRVEDKHYSIWMKIAYSTALGHCLCSSRLLAPLRMCMTSCGARNTAHFCIATYCNYCHKWFACLEGYLSIVCASWAKSEGKRPWEALRL